MYVTVIVYVTVHVTVYATVYVTVYVTNDYVCDCVGGSNSIFVCRFCEHFAKKGGESAHKILRSWHELLLLHDLSASTDQERGYPGIQKHSQS